MAKDANSNKVSQAMVFAASMYWSVMQHLDCRVQSRFPHELTKPAFNLAHVI